MNIIVSLDSSGPAAGVCVLENGAVRYEKTLCEGFTHSETLLPHFIRALDACHLAIQQVDLYAVTAGPGSFTGLRIGMALVKGLALPHDTPVVPVSTLEAIAASVSFEGTVVPSLDARRGEVYWAAFDGRKANVRLAPDSVGPPSAFQDLFTHSTGPVLFVGNGAKICYNNYKYGPNISCVSPELSPPIARGAAFLALNAAQQGNRVPAAQTQPVYLRLSQAEREHKRKQLSHM